MTLWLVFGPGLLLRRLVVHWSIVFGLFVPCAIGLAIFTGESPPDIVQVWSVVLLALPVVSLAAQLPLWPLRTHLGWRVEVVKEQKSAKALQPLSIRDLLLATVVVAVSLTGVRVLQSVVGASRAQSESSFWIAWITAVVVIAGVSTVSLPPALWFMLRIKDTRTAVRALYGYAVLAATLTLTLASLIASRFVPAGMFALATAVLSFAATLSLPLFIVRGRGYRLTFQSERNF
jgi:hypothetical protein